MTFLKVSHFEEVGEAYASDPRLRNPIIKERFKTMRFLPMVEMT